MERLLDVLRGFGLESRVARDALATGKVFLGGVPTSDGGRMVAAASVRYQPDAPRLTPGRDPALIYRDPQVAVLWKPSGMLSVPAPRRQETNMMAFAGKILGTVFPVHRLDEGTSGLMLAARSLAAQQSLKEQLEKHTVERRYLALARGKVATELAVIKSLLVRDRGDGKRGSWKEEDEEGEPDDGKEAVTEIRGLQALKGATLVEARLQTGRTHQVRIHLSEIRHPILGDPLYGDGSRSFPRVALHAAVIGFRHPTSGAALRFEAPLADDLESWCRDHGGRA